MNPSTERSIRLDVPTLTRVEGEGAMHVSVVDGIVERVELEIYEPPRFFEALLRGRAHTEPPDITARICGICPIAYQMSACLALESAAGVEVSAAVRDLRRLLYCGEWIESHVLHVAFLHAPDFLGLPSGIDVAAQHPDLYGEVLHLKQTGNRIIDVIGGRPIHPVNLRLGGFHRTPERAELDTLRDDLERARESAEALARWVAGFEFPDFRIASDSEHVSLRDGAAYPIDAGRIVSDRGLDVAIEEFGELVDEYQVPRSTALHAVLGDATGELRHYRTGPMARWRNNHDLLPDSVADLGRELGIGPNEDNPFRSIVVRSLETVWAVDEARRLLAAYERPERHAVDVPAVPGVGHGCTEAPRGILYHRYEIGADELLADAVIVPPTSQNQDAIEADLREFVDAHLDLPDDELGLRCEQIIRNHDPCISCATHFLRVTIDRS